MTRKVNCSLVSSKKRLSIFTFLILFFVACSVQAKDESSADAVLYGKLVGVWLIDHQSQDFTARGEVAFNSDGTFNTWANLVSKEVSTKSIRYKGSWEVKNGTLIETITEANDPEAVGKITIDEILRIW